LRHEQFSNVVIATLHLNQVDQLLILLLSLGCISVTSSPF